MVLSKVTSFGAVVSADPHGRITPLGQQVRTWPLTRATTAAERLRSVVPIGVPPKLERCFGPGAWVTVSGSMGDGVREHGDTCFSRSTTLPARPARTSSDGYWNRAVRWGSLPP